MRSILTLVRALALLGLTLALLLCAAACNDGPGTEPGEETCTTHTDGDGDGKCDTCGTETGPVCDHIDINGDNKCELCGGTVVEEVPFVLTLMDVDGNPLSGATVTVKWEQDTVASGTTGVDGTFGGTILPDRYTVHIDGLPEGWVISGNGSPIDITAESGSFSYVAEDNNPDGTEQKPYYVGDETVTVTIPAGQTYHCFTKGSAAYLLIDNDNVKVTYNGKDYLPEDGHLKVLILGTANTNDNTPFTVTNTASGDNQMVLTLEALPGSSGAPYEAKLDETLTTTVDKDETIYYRWVADRDGYLILHTETAGAYIMMYNTTSLVVTGYTSEVRVLYLAVSRGDSISVLVASRGTEETNQVSFDLSICAGTEDDPLILRESATLRLPVGKTVTVCYLGETGADITLPATGLKLTDMDGKTVEAAGGKYNLSIASGDGGHSNSFVLTNTGSAVAEVTFTVTPKS